MSWFGDYRSSPHDQRKFTVYMNEGERDQINKWVERHENIETGGDLFGAWIDNRTAVVQFVLGPGKGCRRTGVSFFQDIDYLRNAGSYLTQKHGLCNIGQWHSHHRLGLTRPSGGDENTVWGNMPNLGLDRYIVIIATIPGSYSNRKLTVNINPYLFEIKNGYRSGVIPGSFSFLERNSPFRMDKGIQNEVEKGAEITNLVTIYSDTETETTNSGKRPCENKSDESAAKIAKTEAEDMSHRKTQSLARNAENFNKNEGGTLGIPAGDGTERNPEDVRNENEENGQFIISQEDDTELEDVSGNDDEQREQSNIGQSDATKQNLEDIPHKDDERKKSNISQYDITKKNQNIWNDDEVSERSNMEQGGATDRTSEDVPNKDEEGKQSIILQDEAKKKNQNISNEDEVSELSNMEQSGATDITPEDVPNKDEESKQSNTSQDEATKKNQNISNANEVSEQANIEQGGATNRTPEDLPNTDEESKQSNTSQDEATKKNQNISNANEVSEQANIEQGGATNRTPEDLPNTDEESKQSNTSQDEATKKNQNISNANEVRDQSNIGPGQAIERNPEKDPTQEEESRQFNAAQGDDIERTPKDVINENEESKKSSIPPEGSQNSSNKELNRLSNIGQEGVQTDDAETGQSSILRDGSESNVQAEVDSNMMDLDDDHEEDSSSKGSQAETQIRDENGIAFSSEGFKGTQSKLSNFPNTYSNPQKMLQGDSTIGTIDNAASDNDQVKSNTGLPEEVFGGEQPKTSPNNVDSNQHLEKDSKNTSNHVTSTPPDENNQKQIDAADNNAQKTSPDNLETVETFEKHGSNNDQVEFDSPLLGDVPTDEQSKIPPNDVSNNLDLKQDLNDTGKHVISISSDTNNENQIDANDIINDQLPTSDTQERHDQDFLHDPKVKVLTSHEAKKVEANDARDGCQIGQCGQLDILQKDTENYLKQNLDKDSLNHFPTKQHDYKTEEERTKNEKDEDTLAKKDEELDGAIADETMPLESNKDQNSITGNSGFQKRRGELNEKQDRKFNGAQGCDEIKNATESPNIPVAKPEKRQSRSIFDSLEELDEKQELSSNSEMHENFVTKDGVDSFKQNETNNEGKNSPDTTEADTKIETEDGVDTFTENEKKNEGKNSQDNKQSLPDPQPEQSNKPTQVEKTGSDTAKNNEVTTENPNTDGPSASETQINEDKAVGIEVDQNEMYQITAHKKKRKRKRGLTGIFRKNKRKKLESHDDNGENGTKKKSSSLMGVFKKNKSKKKSESQDGNGENEITKRESKSGKSKKKKTNVNTENDTNEADTKIELVEIFEESNTNNEAKDSHYHKQSLPVPQSDTSKNTTQIEKTGSDTAKNDVITENPKKDGPSASEIEINENKAGDIEVFQNEMDQITVHNKERKRKRRLTSMFKMNKSKKKLESEEDKGESETKKEKSKFWKRKSWKSKKEKVDIENENGENIEKTTRQESKVKTKTSRKKNKEKKSSEKKGDKKEKKKDKNEKKDNKEKKKNKNEKKEDKKEKKKDKKRGAEKMETGEKEKT